MLLGASALVIDMGNLYFSYQELLSATQAAAKAAGQSMANPNATSVTSVADQYSGWTSSDYNHNANLKITNVTVSFDCINPASYGGFNLPPCATSGNSSFPGCTVNATYNPSGGCNVVKVVETATVQTFFAKVFGVTSLNISATATSSAGGAGVPYHIVIALDSTHSMGSGTDTNCSAKVAGSFSPEQCAQLGVQSLLSVLATGTGTNPIDEVALMTFPGVTPSQTTNLTNTVAGPTASDDYACPAKNPSITSYNNNPEYLIVGFPSGGAAGDYISSTGGLNPKSDLVDSVGASQITNGGSCSGIQTPGGEGTFYAGAIIAAQEYLSANHYTGVQDVIIFLSDGNAGNGDTSGSVPQNVTVADMSGKVFSNSNQCTQAVNAANWAKGYAEPDNTNTKIYAVAYGSGSSGCSSGETYTPCTTMQNIASTPSTQYFFSVKQGSSSYSCNNANPNISAMDQVFTYIGGRLTGARLIPNADF
jgi:hypothetical protein